MLRVVSPRRAVCLWVAVALLVGCGPVTNPPQNLPVGPTPTPTPGGSTSGTLTVMPGSALTFAGTGATYAQTITVTDSVSTASLTVGAGTCGSGGTAIATFGTAVGSGTSFTIVVTPANAGSCSATVSDTHASSIGVSAVVNSGSVGLTGRR